MVVKVIVLIIILATLGWAGAGMYAYLRMKQRPPVELYENRRKQPDFTPLLEIPERYVGLVVSLYETPLVSQSRCSSGNKRSMVKQRLDGSCESISFQLARNLYFRFGSGWLKTITERMIAEELEKKLGNGRILEMYLNIMYFGNDVYGITDASHFYFGKALWELSLNQMVMLACIPLDPVSANPLAHPGAFVHKRNAMLNVLLKSLNPVLTPQEAAVIEEYGPECLDPDLRKTDAFTADGSNRMPMGNERFGPSVEGIWKTMPYTNSPMVVYTLLSPNHSWMRTHSIDRITPHCAVGQFRAEELGKFFSGSPQESSSNYGIDKDGRIGMYVEERNRSWCSSSETNDQRAVTIECASETTDPYAMNEAVYESLICLCADICKRYGKKKLLWLKEKEKTLAYEPAGDEMILTVHRWFLNKECPGRWLLSRMDDLAEQVTERLESE